MRVEACGFSHHDVLIMEGALRRGVRLPRVLGHEVAGAVLAVGAGVSGALVGLEAVVMPGDLGHRRDGGWAEMLTAPADALVPLRRGALSSGSALLASPIGVALKTVEACALAAGDALVVTGVSGGVGAHAAQAAHAAGARVIGVSTSRGKGPFLEAQPWLDAVLFDDEPWEEAVRALTGGEGADAAIDTVGPSLPRLVSSLRRGGRIVIAGQVSAGSVPFVPAEALFRELTITGSLGAERRHVEQAARLVGEGAIVPLVQEEIGLSAASLREAHGRLKRREVIGRLVVRP